ncbi:MMPL family transporter [Actinocorallia longicatena]|uniref:MMPL family transporter n=1 Tax=Actinocorallia longicatena TaxID=111803 RepID=A0ABP6QI73_9ACTN
MFLSIGRFVVRYRWWVILAWIVTAVLLVSFAPKFEVSNEQTDFLPEKYGSVQAVDLQARAFPQDKGTSAFVVVTRADGQPLTAADQAKAAAMAKGLDDAHIKGVTSVTMGPVSPNKKVAMLPIRFASENAFGDAEVTEGVKTIRDELGRVQGDLKTYVTGDAAVNSDSEESFKKSDSVTLTATAIVIVILLLLTFRAVIAALLPLVTVGLVMMVAFALIGTVNKIFDLKADNTTQSLMPIVLLGIGTDYILFLLFRYRERLRAGEDSKTAMVNAVHKVGEVITSAAAAVIIAFLALLLASLGMLKSLGPSMSIGIATTLVAALTLIPAVVSLLGPKVFWPSKNWMREPEGRTAGRIGAVIGRRPGVVALVSGLVLAAFAVLASGYQPNFDLASAPKGTESADGLVALGKGFPPGAQQVTQLYVTAPQPLDPAEVTRVSDAAEKVPGIGAVGEPVYSADKKTALVEVQLATNPLSTAAMDTIEPLRDAVDGATPAGKQAFVGGATAIFTDLQSAMNRDYAIIFPVAGLLIAIVLGLLLRSMVAPVYLILAVVLSFLGTIGASVLVFQHILGHSGVIFMLPLLVYLFVVALGTDYNILMIARLREEARAGHPPREGVVNAFRQAAPTIASAGLILAGSFGTFLLASSDAMQEIGTSVAMGVLLSAFVMSLFLVPAITVLLGHKAWWPGHGDAPVHDAPLVEAKTMPEQERSRREGT